MEPLRTESSVAFDCTSEDNPGSRECRDQYSQKSKTKCNVKSVVLRVFEISILSLIILVIFTLYQIPTFMFIQFKSSHSTQPQVIS